MTTVHVLHKTHSVGKVRIKDIYKKTLERKTRTDGMYYCSRNEDATVDKVRPERTMSETR